MGIGNLDIVRVGDGHFSEVGGAKLVVPALYVRVWLLLTERRSKSCGYRSTEHGALCLSLGTAK